MSNESELMSYRQALTSSCRLALGVLAAPSEAVRQGRLFAAFAVNPSEAVDAILVLNRLIRSSARTEAHIVERWILLRALRLSSPALYAKVAWSEATAP